MSFNDGAMEQSAPVEPPLTVRYSGQDPGYGGCVPAGG
jgi:hypothetical protein